MLNPQPIINIANAFHQSCTLFAAIQEGIFDAIAQLQPANAESIAKKLNLNVRATELLCNALAAIQLLEKKEDSFSISPLTSAFLLSSSPVSLAKAILYNRDVLPAWTNISTLLKSGTPAESPKLHLGENAERTKAFVHAMHERAMSIGRSVIPLLKLHNAKSVFDVGGGPCAYARLMCDAFQNLNVTVIDLPDVINVAENLLNRYQHASRIVRLSGDYHTAAFPTQLDAINFFGVLHQESKDSIRDLFKKAYQSLNSGGVIHVLDVMTDHTHTQPTFSAMFAINMALTTYHGWVFSDAELKEWLSDAGFKDFYIEHLPPPMPHWLAYAYKR